MICKLLGVLMSISQLYSLYRLNREGYIISSCPGPIDGHRHAYKDMLKALEAWLDSVI